MNVAVGYESRRKRILALHGRGGNSTVTKAQLQNLGLSETEFISSTPTGLITDDRSGIGLEAMGGLVQGPWHSWLPDISNDDSLTFDAALQDAVCDAVRSVLLLIERYGPFDGIFGFSQGAVIATLVNNLAYEKNLKSALEKRYGKVGDFLTSDDFLFDSIIIACAGLAIPYSQFRQRAGLGPMSIATPASNIVHLIGREDQFKTWSESFALAFDSFNSSIFYMKSGHEINLLVRDKHRTL